MYVTEDSLSVRLSTLIYTVLVYALVLKAISRYDKHDDTNMQYDMYCNTVSMT